MLQMESRKARETFTEGLHSVLKDFSLLRAEVLSAIHNMNTVKKGMADLTLDYDKVLAALQSANTIASDGLTAPESSALIFNALNLLRSEEYAVRDYALHSVGKLVSLIPNEGFLSCEKWLLSQLKVNQNELVLKSILATLKQFIVHTKTHAVQYSISVDLLPLLPSNENEEDFFSQILSMQIQHRQKALRRL